MAQKELETQVKLWWCDAGCTAGVQLFVLLDGSRKNQIRHINHSFFLLDPRKKSNHVYKSIVLLDASRKNPIDHVYKSFVLLDGSRKKCHQV